MSNHSPAPSLPTRLTTWIAIACFAIAAFFYSPLSTTIVPGDLFLVPGGMMMAVSVLTAQRRFDDRPAATTPDDIPLKRIHWIIFATGVLCLWLMAEGSSALIGLGIYPMNQHLQVMLFCIGIILVTLGLSRHVAGSISGLNGRILLPLLVITSVGFVLRIINLENSVHMFVDEMNFAEGVVALRHTPNRTLLLPMSPIASFPWTFAYLQRLAAGIVGSNLAALRLPSAILGTLTIPAVYLLARTYFDRRAALLAALLLAVFPPHIALSRIGLNNIADPLFGVLMLGFLERGRRDGRRGDFVLAGTMLGLTQYWYEGGKLVFPVLIALWLLITCINSLLSRFSQKGDTNDTSTGVRWRFILLFLLTAVIVAAPTYYVNAAFDLPGAPRLQDMGDTSISWQDMLLAQDGGAQLRSYVEDRLSPALYHYIQRPDGGELYYGGHTALILPYLLPLFFVGLFVLLWRGRWMIPAVLLLTALGNSLLEDPDWTARFAVAIPFLPVIVAVGAVWLWDVLLAHTWIAATSPRRRVLIGAVIALMMVQVVYYFGPHMTTYNQQIRPFRDHQDVGWRVRDLPPGTKAFLFTDELTFLPHIQGMERYWEVDLDVSFVSPWELRLRSASRLPYAEGGLAFFLPVDDRQTMALLAQSFDLPEPQWSPYPVPRDRQYLMFYIAP